MPAAVNTPPVEEIVETVRQTRAGADLEVLVVGCNEDDVTEATVAELFHVTAEGVQNPAQGFAARDPLEHLHFSCKQILRLFQIVDVNLECYVADDVALCVADRDAACTRPPIDAVRVAHAHLQVQQFAL